MGLKDEAFDVLYRDLCAHDSRYVGKDVLLCPMCLCRIPKDEVLARGIEHIIPQNVVGADAPTTAGLGTKNQRCGITVLCRQPRLVSGKEAKDGCNGFKGSTYDRLFKYLFDDKDHEKAELSHRHRVAILVMAYLGAFQYLGYSYILRNELAPVREQFNFPDDRKTDWLDGAEFSLAPPAQVIATETGQPFIIGGLFQRDAVLHVMFRRCEAYLPGGHWAATGVDLLDSLLPKYP